MNPKIKLFLNGTPCEYAAANLAGLLEQLTLQPPFAVAVNAEFVPKSGYAARLLHEGDSIEIVSPVVGG